jgi:hypothetical protein
VVLENGHDVDITLRAPGRTRLAAIVTLVLCGCSTTRKSIPPDFKLGAEDQPVVIGRVNGSEYGTMPVARIAFFDRLHPVELEVRNETTGDYYSIVCDEEGGNDAYFYVTLPPGSYVVTSIFKGHGYAANGVSVDAPFERHFFSGFRSAHWGVERGRTGVDDAEGRSPKFVVGNEPLIYVGTLEVTREQNHRRAGWYFGDIPVAEGHGEYLPELEYVRGWNVKDEYDGMLKTFRSKYPQIHPDISKSLMVE